MIDYKNSIIMTDAPLMKRFAEVTKKEGFFTAVSMAFKIISDGIKRYFTFYLPLKKKLKQSVNGLYLAKTEGGPMLVDLNDQGISRELAVTGCHERNSTDHFKTIIKPGWTCIEAGSNVGYYALLAAELAGPEGFIYAFEPSKENFHSLVTNVRINNKEDQFHFENIGLGDKEGNLKFYLLNRGNMCSFLERKDSGDIKNLDYVEVPVKKLDDVLPKDKKIDFVRMDVEGYEHHILRGMEGILKSDRKPEGFFIEIHSYLLNDNGSSTKEFMDYLRQFGYEIDKAFWRGQKGKKEVNSTEELYAHELCEEGYWEAFITLKS